MYPTARHQGRFPIENGRSRPSTRHAYPKAWPIQFRHDADGRKWRCRCELKAAVWNAWQYIHASGHIATAREIAQLARLSLRTTERTISLLKRQHFVENVKKCGMRGPMQVRFRMWRSGSCECGGVNSFSFSKRKREEESSEPRSLDDLKNSFLAKCEDPEGIIAAICEIALLRKAKNGGDTPKHENWFTTCVRTFNWEPGSKDREDYQQYLRGSYAP